MQVGVCLEETHPPQTHLQFHNLFLHGICFCQLLQVDGAEQVGKICMGCKRNSGSMHLIHRPYTSSCAQRCFNALYTSWD